ncbi:MAG: tetratricopeptide repeat protein [Planctomycetota bacterium]|nr:tetratricopeptide repeat protein [Planctomycetota bacterium]
MTSSGDTPPPPRPTHEELEAIAAGATMSSHVLEYLSRWDEDGSVQAELEALQKDQDFLSDFIEANRDRVRGPAPITEQPAPDGYEIIRELDRGGQGVVYLARQLRTKREVALKMIIQAAFTTERQKQRFEREVELVASMKHPNIVTVFDSGVTPDGRLFTAMEYIKGVPLNVFRMPDGSEEGRVPDRRERIGVFLKVCAAVNSAHLRAIIHRDLKPLNILVDDECEPHVLDFGLAKVVGPEAMTDTAMAATAAGEFMGTFAYASPEQVSGDPELIDTRTDVYALGVILYELLLDQRPYELGGSINDMIKGIMEVQPTRPTSVDPGFDRDLETILLMALAKDPDRRFQSVRDLADDLEHWLNGEPILARRDDAWYVLRKYVRRHRLPVSLAAGFVLLLIAFAITMSVLFTKVTIANQRLAGTLGMASNVIASADPENVQRGSTATTAVDMLLAWSEVVQADLGDDPDISSRIYNDLGESFIGFDRYDLAQRHLERAYAAIPDAALDTSPEAARTLRNLGRIAYKQGRWDKASEYFQRCLDIRRRTLIPPHPDIADSLQQLGSTYRHLQRAEEAEAYLRESLAMYDRLLNTAGERDRGPLEAAQASVFNGLGLLLSRSRPEEAIGFYTKSIELLDNQPGDDDWRVARLKHNIGMCHFRTGDLEAASDHIEESLRIKEAGLRRLQAESRDVRDADAGNRLQIATGKQALSSVLLQREQYDRAGTLAAEALAIRSDVLEPDHYQLSDSRELLGRINLRTGRIDEAIALLDAIRVERRNRGDTPARIAWTESNLGRALLAAGRMEEAEAMLNEAWKVLSSDEGPGPQSPQARETAMAMIDLYERTGRPDRGERIRNLIDSEGP